MPFIDHVKLFTDGCSRGNPGAASIGILILDGSSNGELKRYNEAIGHMTNNRAEYRALLKGLELCAAHTRRRVTCHMDSELVCKQMNGDYRITVPELRDLCLKVKNAAQLFDSVTYVHTARTNPYMRKVDRMANEALEGRGPGAPDS